MCAIAKWLIVTSAAATQGDIFPSRCTEGGTAGVAQFDIAFDAQRTIISDRDFSRHAHLPSLGVHRTDNTTDIDKEGRALASSLSRSTISQIAPHQAVKFASGRIVVSPDAVGVRPWTRSDAAIMPSALRQAVFHIGAP